MYPTRLHKSGFRGSFYAEDPASKPLHTPAGGCNPEYSLRSRIMDLLICLLALYIAKSPRLAQFHFWENRTILTALVLIVPEGGKNMGFLLCIKHERDRT